MFSRLVSRIRERPAGGARSHKTLAVMVVACFVLPAVAEASAPKLGRVEVRCS
jgi:hypothetical protein